MTDLEDRVRELETAQVRLEVKLQQVADELHRLNGGINRLLWVIAGSVVGSAVLWVIRGGLAQ